MLQAIRNKMQWVITTIISIILDALLMCAWIGVQYVVGIYFVNKLILHGIDHHVRILFQFLFAIFTAVPVCIYLFTDLIVICKRSWKRIKK